MTNDNKFTPFRGEAPREPAEDAASAAAARAQEVTPEERAQQVMDAFPANSRWNECSDVVHHAIATAIREAEIAGYERGKAEERKRCAVKVSLSGYDGCAELAERLRARGGDDE